ncbi:MAG: CsbD family protein [Terracidiphilus sp.]|nr:CsbD family protein [Terracidiphilus sp.]
MHGGRELVFGGQEPVDKDRLKGAINEIAGRAKRQVGEWTGDSDAQIEGLAQEVKGKAQKAWGGVKEAVRAARNEARRAKEKTFATHADAAGTDDPQAAQPTGKK